LNIKWHQYYPSMFCHLKVVEATPPLSTLQSSDASKLEQRWLTILF